MFDMHVHTSFSHDGKSSAGEYVELLGKDLIDEIGFTEHVDFMPECGGYGTFDYKSYRQCMQVYRNKGFAVHAGAEIDYAARVENDIHHSLDLEPFEYTICSVHMINGLSVSTDKNMEMYYDSFRFEDLLLKYYSEVTAGINSNMFDVIGHIGIYKRYLNEEFFLTNTHKNLVTELDNELCRLCAASGTILEVNTSGYNTPRGTTFPDYRFLKMYYSYGGRMICLGSDAHRSIMLGSRFDHALGMLKDVGFDYIYKPWDKHLGIKID